MPGIERAEKKSFGAVMPEIATGNTTIFTQSQVEKTLSDAQKAVLIITLMGFALGGKKTDSTVSLSPEHVKKTGRPGTHVGYLGYLHHFLIGRNCLESLWLNLLTMEGVQEIGYQHGIGVPPWEKMPEGEICPRANDFKNSLMGRLVPLSRFCLLTDSDLHYSEGISHPSHGEGGRDPTIAIDSSKKPKAMWTDPSKRPWRWLSSMLGFLSTTNKNQWHCLQLSQGLRRARTFSFTTIGIWSAGLRVSGNAGEQYVSGTDDFVESRIELQSAWIGDPWFIQLQAQMEQLEDLSKVLGSSVRSYFKEQKVDGSEQAHRALSFYWQLCEKEVHALLKACDETGSDNLNALWKRYVDYARAAFDSICPKDTARQLDAWSKHRSNVSKFINKDKKKKHER
jgi:CRISPR system Cascade subunit CasA